MASKIEWLDWPFRKAETWNPWIGCTPARRGCEHCWAKREEDGRFRHLGRCLTRKERESIETCLAEDVGYSMPILSDSDRPYFWRGPVWQGDDVLKRPLHWKAPRVVFVGARTDVHHEGISHPLLDRVVDVMARCPQHIFILLTKRAKRMYEYWSAENRRSDVLDQANGYSLETGDAMWRAGWPLPNVLLGVSPCDAEDADQMIPYLIRTPAATRIVSIEPMLGPIDLRMVSFPTGSKENVLNHQVSARAMRAGIDKLNAIDWVIAGAESGSKARFCDRGWIESLVEQCSEWGVPCFVKQVHLVENAGEDVKRFRLSKNPLEWGPRLQVRQLPSIAFNYGRE